MLTILSNGELQAIKSQISGQLDAFPAGDNLAPEIATILEKLKSGEELTSAQIGDLHVHAEAQDNAYFDAQDASNDVLALEHFGQARFLMGVYCLATATDGDGLADAAYELCMSRGDPDEAATALLSRIA